MIPVIYHSRDDKIIEEENRLVVAKGTRGEVTREGWYQRGLCADGTVPYLDCGSGYVYADMRQNGTELHSHVIPMSSPWF